MSSRSRALPETRRAHVAPNCGQGRAPADRLDQPVVRSLQPDKWSIVVDLSEARDRAAFDALTSRADTFVANLSGPSLRRLDLDHETLRAKHPRLINACAAGPGSAGPRADDLYPPTAWRGSSSLVPV